MGHVEFIWLVGHVGFVEFVGCVGLVGLVRGLLDGACRAFFYL